MSLITRYLLRQFLGPLFVCLVAFNGIFILFDLFGHLSKFLDADLGLALVLRYYAGVVSSYMHWFVPASCMLATLYSMWQLSHHSELTAMRASGISFHRLTLPFFGVAFAMSLLTFANLEWVSPQLSAWSDRLKENNFRPDGDGAVRRDRPFTCGDREWVFEAADWTSDETMAHPPGRVTIRSERRGTNGAPDIHWGVRAERADWLDGQWWLTKPVFMHFDADGSELVGSELAGPALPDLMPFPELTETPHDMVLSRKTGAAATLPLRDMLQLIRSKGDNAEPEDWYDFWYRVAAPIPLLQALKGHGEGLAALRRRPNAILTDQAVYAAVYVGVLSTVTSGRLLPGPVTGVLGITLAIAASLAALRVALVANDYERRLADGHFGTGALRARR